MKLPGGKWVTHMYGEGKKCNPYIQGACKPQDITNEVRMIDKKWLQRYLVTSEYRRIIAGEYLDGSEWSCDEISGLRCDNCRLRVTTEAAELPRYRKQVAKEATAGQETMRVLDDLNGLCMYCLMCEMNVVEDHRFRNCPASVKWNARLEYEQYRVWRKDLRLEQYMYCYHCRLPQDLCDRNDPETETTTCRWPDVALVLCFLAIRGGGLQQWASGNFGLEFQTEQMATNWIAGSQLWGGKTLPRIIILLRTIGMKFLEEKGVGRYAALRA